ncbi:hypothetical protein [Mycolicibacter kumamotonensis]|uniref:Uncharacterized protein n=1 Tax=Mycolicibacter kumamotonensis TaxID=354243 RepID=A0A1B8SBU0_9MYCO|nr:hypothetical protein [Mycolicibacter kumamotonensis]NDJ90595.1 hypothetical protein [Mycolicibacter kumamotonensis]OBY30203.1 hypothetical protein ACT18_18800 [Mycolicibacter kumamotonensis]ORA77044.1 hypothetical protein BST28_19190 [Mycolicibacter kumamotonensis]
MDTHTRKYRLPDHGYTIVRWAHELAKGRGAVAVEPDVEGIRRPDGALAFVDAAPFKTVADGPAAVLRELLDLEAREIRSWSKTGFARFHRLAAARRVDRICREQGSEAAVDWVLANATAEVNIGELRDRLGARLYNAGGFDEDYYRAEVGRCIEHRRRRHLKG